MYILIVNKKDDKIKMNTFFINKSCVVFKTRKIAKSIASVESIIME